MIFRLLLSLIAYAVGLAVGALIVKRVLRPMLEARKRRLLGARNASEVCSLCFDRVDPRIDFYDGRKWSHAECVRLLLNPNKEEGT